MVAGWCSKLCLSCVCIGEYYYDISGIFFLLSLVTDELESKFVQLASSLGLSQWYAVSYEKNGKLDVITVLC